MQKLSIERGKSTPGVEFNNDTGVFSIEGQSYPENALQFYTPVFAWLDDFLGGLDHEGALFEFNLQYMNTSSSKCLMDIIDRLDEAYSRGKRVAITWYYDQDNESLLECAEEFSEDVSVPFTIVAVEG